MRPPRISYAGGVYHVTIRCNNREFNFKGDDDFALYIRVLLEAKAKYDVKIYAYCLTNNHIHLLVAIEMYGSRFSIEITIRDLKQHFGFTDYQCYSSIAFFRFVTLSCVAFCSWMITLLKNDSFLEQAPQGSFQKTSLISFSRLKSALKRFVIQQIIFQRFNDHADFAKINEELEPLFRVS